MGDTIKITRRNDENEGMLMPHYEFSDDDILNIKLKNGYNIGISVNPSTKIVLIKKNKTVEKKTQKIPYDQKKPQYLSLEQGEQ